LYLLFIAMKLSLSTHASTFALLLAVANAAPVPETDAGITVAREDGSMVTTSHHHRRESGHEDGLTSGGDVSHGSSAGDIQDLLRGGQKHHHRREPAQGYQEQADTAGDN
jgi:hypothetical protein